MSDLRKNNKNNKSVRNLAVLNSATQLSVLKMNRLVLALLFGLMVMVVFMGIWRIDRRYAFIRQKRQ